MEKNIYKWFMLDKNGLKITVSIDQFLKFKRYLMKLLSKSHKRINKYDLKLIELLIEINEKISLYYLGDDIEEDEEELEEDELGLEEDLIGTYRCFINE